MLPLGCVLFCFEDDEGPFFYLFEQLVQFFCEELVCLWLFLILIDDLLNVVKCFCVAVELFFFSPFHVVSPFGFSFVVFYIYDPLRRLF